jgi:hypothetical protein
LAPVRFGLLGHLLHFLLDHVFDWTVAAVRAWAGWFWRLRAGAKFAALALQIVLLYLIVSWLSLGRFGAEIVQVAALGLAFFAIASLLFGSTNRS